MKLSNFSKSYDALGESNRMLLVIAVSLSVALACLSVVLLNRHERVVLVPSYIDQKMEVSWNSANQAYYKSLGVNVAMLIGNVTPGTLKFTTDYLGMVMSADIYAKVKPQLTAYGGEDSFKRGTVFTYFTVQTVFFEDKVNKVFVTGFLNTSPMEVASETGASRIAVKQVTYEMQFKMANGRPLIVGFDSYEGNKPKTQEWLKRNHKRLEAMAENAKEQK